MPASLRFLRLTQISCVAVVSLVTASGHAQTAQCPAIESHPETPALLAYGQGQYSHAEDLYGQALNAAPQDLQIHAALVQTLLHEAEIPRASSEVDKMLAVDPHSAITLTAQAELQLRQGEPWLALETAKAAEGADRCYARAHLIRSRVLRIDSMYATERAEIQRAYDIDPTDPDIRHAFLSIVSPAHEVEGIHEGLAAMKDIDEESRQKATNSMLAMLPMVTENSQTCKVLPSVESAALPLLPFYLDPKHVDGYRLEVDLPQTKVKLTVDTAASGVYITRALADQNGLKADPNDPPGTVRAEKVTIGPLEFRDCLLGVSETPFAGKADGFIGTDIFASYLITLNQPQSKLVLNPLPKQADVLLGDRASAPELHDFTPVYHRQQYLLVPVMLNNKTRKLFILDTGIRFSTMTPEVAHSISTTKMNFTNPVQTVSGSTLQVYRDSFNMQFANVSLAHESHVLEFDPAAVEQNSGLQIAGMLGFDMMHSLVLHLDYRDGLVKLESPEGEGAMGHGNTAIAANQDEKMECPKFDDSDLPTSATLEVKVMNLLDSSHLKPGKELLLKVVNEFHIDKCIVPEGSYVYGHVTEASSSKGGGKSQLGLVFDHADCFGHSKSEMTLKVLGLVAPPGEYVGLHSALPAEVSGSGRQISNAVIGAYDENLNPGGPPHTLHPGIVAGYEKVKLNPVGGPGCSAQFSSAESSVRLWTGSSLLMTVQMAQ
jgi:hypothetical protein